MKTSVILLAGGIGRRMVADMPKQFLLLDGKPLILHSLDVFLAIPEVDEIVVVCGSSYRHVFEGTPSKLIFADPGDRRQDSVFNGLQKVSPDAGLVCVHDSARPLITPDLVCDVIAEATRHGAATLGLPVSFTVKYGDDNNFVVSTPDRSDIWEIQTPQVVSAPLLREGFLYANNNNITVTDDVSLVELIRKPVKLVEGSTTNIKITTPKDLIIAENIIKK